MINISLSTRSSQPGVKLADITERKTYAQTQMSEVIDLRSFAEHIAEHGCVYHHTDIAGILTRSVDCLHELLLAGKIIQLGDLGKFYPTVQTEGAETAADFSANNIKKVKVKWVPSERFDDLTAKAEFQLVASRMGQRRLLKKERGLEAEGAAEANADGANQQNAGGNQQNQNNGQAGGNAGGGNGDNPDGLE